MSNPTNPVSVGTEATSILSSGARKVAIYLKDDATLEVTLTVTWSDGTVEIAYLLPGGPYLCFEGRPPTDVNRIATITGAVASGTQNVYRAVLQP